MVIYLQMIIYKLSSTDGQFQMVTYKWPSTDVIYRWSSIHGHLWMVACSWSSSQFTLHSWEIVDADIYSTYPRNAKPDETLIVERNNNNSWHLELTESLTDVIDHSKFQPSRTEPDQRHRLMRPRLAASIRLWSRRPGTPKGHRPETKTGNCPLAEHLTIGQLRPDAEAELWAASPRWDH